MGGVYCIISDDQMVCCPRPDKRRCNEYSSVTGRDWRICSLAKYLVGFASELGLGVAGRYPAS